ncbi:MAG: iron-containing alcohol dehydrogenase [Bacilli bacterium]|nr:iron-containing alcohol dehydrogenase [Bacilli bacterium]
MAKIKLFSRIYQKIMKVACYFIKWPKPFVIEGTNSSLEIVNVIKENKLQRPLIIVDPFIDQIGLMKHTLDSLDQNNIKYIKNIDVKSEPNVLMIEDIVSIYKESNCDSIIAVGGGSIIDTAKLVGARVTNPNKSISKMKGVLKVRKQIPFTITIPTTSGSGSECTVAAVVKDGHSKYAVNSPKLVPNVAVLDPMFTISLPVSLTLTTGMDALTHAIECYIGNSNTKTTYQDSIEAISLILNSLESLLANTQDVEKRLQMQKASYLAGAAFTRGYVGYVHSIAHALGAYYNIPHGEANAVLLPLVLEKYKEKIKNKMLKLVDKLDESNLPNEEKLSLFYSKIKSLSLKVKKSIGFTKIDSKDYQELIKHIQKETWPLYPVPRYLEDSELIDIFEKVKENA